MKQSLVIQALRRTANYTLAQRALSSTSRTAAAAAVRVRSVVDGQQQRQQKQQRRYSSSGINRKISTSDGRTVDRLVVIGSGVAGSTAALIAAETYQIPVTIFYAGATPTDCNSFWAQGGIIYRNYDPDANDSPEALAADIHRAGDGLCVNEAVLKVANEGPERVRQLLLNSASTGRPFANVPFDVNPNNPNELSLCLEASHSAPRILHKADHTGRTIQQHMAEAVRQHPLIHQQAHTIVTDLILQTDGYDNKNQICVGVRTLDRKTGESKSEYAAAGVVLASGGLAGIYQHTTNPAGFNALGSSVALASRANAALRDLEYVQFHPTALCVPNKPRFLLTEALRGEGAILRDANGRAFARDYHPDGELAPRDVVARAVFAESQKQSHSQDHNTFLDITHRDATWLHQRFPSIHEHVKKLGLDLASDPLPVIPAAHYTCGGVETDLNGCTTVPGLYAAGEAARTGLHGGNRLASTSLLEGLVFGAAVADHAAGTATGGRVSALDAIGQHCVQMETIKKEATTTTTTESQEVHSKRAREVLKRLRQVMWDGVGVVRTPSTLSWALSELQELRTEADELFAMTQSQETAAARDAATAGTAVAQAALRNNVSAGAHYVVADSDMPNSNNKNVDNAELETETEDEEDDASGVSAAAR